MGSTAYAVLRHPDFVRQPHEVAASYWESTGRQAASNGGVMRTSVLGAWRFGSAQQVLKDAEQVCRLSHADPRCVGSCAAVCLAINELLAGENDVPGLIADVSRTVSPYHPEIVEWLELSADASLDRLDLDEGRNPGEANRLGYTLKTLAAGFWALRHAATFGDGLLAIIHEGGDADTNAAVAGALLGARFGMEAIDDEWREGLVHREMLEERTNELVSLCTARGERGLGLRL
jgi:ADP-ribosylglycohydrolase